MEEVTFAVQLKEGTQDLHDQAEAGELQKRMVDGNLLREELIAFLGEIWHVHNAFEPILRDSAKRDSRLDAMITEHHYRLNKIEQDLQYFNSKSPASQLPSTTKFIEFINDLSKNDPISLVGVLYVKEGATNGNKVVAKRIRESLQLGDDCKMGYFDPHGADQRTRWYAFKDALNLLDLSTTERAACLNAARATFQLFMDLSTELVNFKETAQSS